VSQRVARFTDKIVLRLTAKAPLRGSGTFSLLGGEVPIFFFASDSKLTWPLLPSVPQANSIRLSYGRSARSYIDFRISRLFFSFCRLSGAPIGLGDLPLGVIPGYSLIFFLTKQKREWWALLPEPRPETSHTRFFFPVGGASRLSGLSSNNIRKNRAEPDQSFNA